MSLLAQREARKFIIGEEEGDSYDKRDGGRRSRSFGGYSARGNFQRAKSGLLCAKKSGRSGNKKNHHRNKRSQYADGNGDEEIDAEEILTYEEVALYYPRADHKRPVVLIGPPNIGRHELRQRLMLDTDQFAAAIPRKTLFACLSVDV